MGLFDLAGTVATDLLVSAAQAGTLTDPFALPTNESFFLTLQAWAVDPEDGKRRWPLMTHTFPVMPQSLSILKKYLARVVYTPSGTYVEDWYTPKDQRVVAPYPVTITGNFGKRARIFTSDPLVRFDGAIPALLRQAAAGMHNAMDIALGKAQAGHTPTGAADLNLSTGLITGYGQMKYLERLVDISHQPVDNWISEAMNSDPHAATSEMLTQLQTATQTAKVPVEVVMYNWTFHQFVVVLLENVRFSRNYQLNCWTYSLQLTALRDAISGEDAQKFKQDAFATLKRGIVQNVAQAAYDSVTNLVHTPDLLKKRTDGGSFDTPEKRPGGTGR